MVVHDSGMKHPACKHRGARGRQAGTEKTARKTSGGRQLVAWIPLDVTVNYRARAKRLTANLPMALLPLQREELNRKYSLS